METKTVEDHIRGFYEMQKKDIFPKLDPDEDPLPMLFHIGEKVKAVGFAVEGGGTELALAIIQLRKTLGKAEVAVLFNAGWAVHEQPGAPKSIFPPSMRLGRIEIIQYSGVDKNGAVLGTAEIHREKGKPPTLGDLKIESGGISGKIPMALACLLV